ncbi:MAG: NTPase [Nitrospirota bacterium]
MAVRKNILVTGMPGSGKTTLIRKVAESLNDVPAAGFYTEEIREDSQRKGFLLISLGGGRRVLSHVEIASRYRVGKYGVDIEGFDGFLDSLPVFDPSCRLVIIDEIGKMECLSGKFVTMIQQALGSAKPVVATVASVGAGIISDVKMRDDVSLFEVTRNNRDVLPEEITTAVRKLVG